NRAAFHRLLEDETLAAGGRGDGQLHVGELAGAAGLLLVPVGLVLRPGDRLAVIGRGVCLLDLETEHVREALAQQAKVEGPLHADTGKAGGGVLLDYKGRVALGDVGEGAGEFHAVLDENVAEDAFVESWQS